MSKRRIIESIALILLMNTGACAKDWTGFYGGANAGLVFRDIDLRSQHISFTYPNDQCNMNAINATFSPGVQLGYMHQFTNEMITGIEAALSFNVNKDKALSCSCPTNANVADRFSFKNSMQTAIKGRAGRLVNWKKTTLLPYVTTGVSFADSALTYTNEGGDYYSQNNTQAGWIFGAGIEWPLRSSGLMRVEYSYVYYGKNVNMNIPIVYGLIDSNGNARVDLNSNKLVVAINYWF